MQRRRTVLIVEEHAHWPGGHFPVRYVELASAYRELGFEPHVLTSRGRATGRGPLPEGITEHRFGRTADSLYRAGSWLRRPREGRSTETLARAGHAIGTAATMSAARRVGAAMDPSPDLYVVLGWNSDPALIAALSGHGRWLLYQFRSPADALTWRSHTVQRTVRATARSAVARSARRGGTFRLATANDDWCATWSSELSFLRPLRQSVAGARPFTRITDARRELGLDPTVRTAVMFGSGRNSDRTVVLDAFAQLDGWQLVVAGEVADGLRSDPTGVPRLALPGVVDDEVRALVYSVADLAVLSFVPGYWSESGTLMDAVSARIPVVCSAESTAAGIVAELGLGEVFAPGDAATLRQAVQHAADATDPLALDRAHEALSNLTVARQHLESVGVTV